MSEAGAPEHDESRTPYDLALGRLTTASWRVEHAIREIGQGVGLDVDGLGYQNAIDALVRHLAPMTPAPWWGPAATIDALRSWLETAGHCLADRDAAVAALAAHWPPKVLDRDAQELQEVPLAHYDQVADQCRRVVAEFSRLSDDLGLRRMSGAMYCYHAIARNLYEVLTDPSLPRELRPRDTYLNDGRTS